MGRNSAGNETDFGQFQSLQQFQRGAEMAVMNGIEGTAQNANRMWMKERHALLRVMIIKGIRGWGKARVGLARPGSATKLTSIRPAFGTRVVRPSQDIGHLLPQQTVSSPRFTTDVYQNPLAEADKLVAKILHDNSKTVAAGTR